VILEATSVYGQGDKITLPPSILSTLADRDLLRVSQERGQPLFFRLAIPRQNYSFPSSPSLKRIIDDFAQKQQTEPQMTPTHSYSFGDEDDTEHDENHQHITKAYLDELAEEYITYTYATVVEFTQAEGCIGLPPSVASALLRPLQNSTETIQRTLTVDPAPAPAPPIRTKEDSGPDSDATLPNDASSTTAPNAPPTNDTEEGRTPGHIAYGAFPIPLPKIQLSLLAHLPLGTKCGLQPTPDAVRNGFYGLKNIKLALEQSLGRTRGCLNLGDLVHCWFRGKKFDLVVKDVTPGDIGAVSCVNTDIEVDILEVEGLKGQGGAGGKVDGIQNPDGDTLKSTGRGVGYRLSDNTATASTDKDGSATTSAAKAQHEIIDLPNEPPIEQTENVVLIQLRGDGGKMSPRRRFDTTTTTIKHLFEFASATCIAGDTSSTGMEEEFRLVTRFPRRVFQLTADGDTHLSGIDNLSKQELFLVERI